MEQPGTLSQGTRKISLPISFYTHFIPLFLKKKNKYVSMYKVIISLYFTCALRKFPRLLHYTLYKISNFADFEQVIIKISHFADFEQVIQALLSTKLPWENPDA